MDRFARALLEGLPPGIRLYCWGKGLYVVFDEKSPPELLRGMLAEYTRGRGAEPFPLEDGSGHEVRLHPHSIVHTVKQPTSLDAVTALIEGFQPTA